MKAAFIYDNKFIVDDQQNVYDKGAFSYKIFTRYLKHFDELYVMGRREKSVIGKDVELSMCSGKNVYFKFNKNYQNQLQYFINKKKITQPVRELIQQVDVCLIRLPGVIGLIAVEECIKQGKPWIVEVVGCAWEALWNHGTIKGKILAPILYQLNRKAIKKSKHTIYVSERFLQKRYPSAGEQISVSDVEINEPSIEVLQKRIEKINNININETLYLGLIGSLNVDYKGHETAIKCIYELKNRGYDVRLRCLGQGSIEKWREIASKLGVLERIEFCGTLPTGEPVMEWLDNIDIFIIPSLTEGLPRALVEAMSRGCPAIGSNVGGIPELIDEEMIFTVKKYKELSDKIELIITDKQKMKTKAKDNFNKSRNYTKHILDKKREDFFNKFIIEI